MITANSIFSTNSSSLLIELRWPNRRTVERQEVANEEQAIDLVKYLNRRYILDTLRSWARQRHKALEVRSGAGRLLKAAELLVLLSGLDNAKLPALCNAVALHEEWFRIIAPADVSSHHRYYYNSILPIIEYCRRPLKGDDEFLLNLKG